MNLTWIRKIKLKKNINNSFIFNNDNKNKYISLIDNVNEISLNSIINEYGACLQKIEILERKKRFLIDSTYDEVNIVFNEYLNKLFKEEELFIEESMEKFISN